MKSVLFLCTANSARSQMAEAIVNASLGASWIAASAGSHPAARVNPGAIAALAEIGIQHSGRPKSLNEFRNQHFDLVITVCDPSSPDCPVWQGQDQQIHLNYPDPAQGASMDGFRQERDRMSVELPALLEAWS